MTEQANTFNDASGRQWRLVVNVPTMQRVRDETGFDLAALFTAEQLTGLADPVLMVQVLHSMLAPQLTAANVTPEQFAESMHGQAMEDAASALLEAAARFLPPTRAEIVRKTTTKARDLTDAALGIATAKLDELTIEDLQLPQNSGANSIAPQAS